MNQVVITGLGTVNPLGDRTEPFFAALLEGKDGIRPIRTLDVSAYACQVGGEVDSERVTAATTDRDATRGARLLLVAARDAFHDAGLDSLSDDERDHISFVTGTTLGGLTAGEAFYRQVVRSPRVAHPRALLHASMHAPNDQVMAALGLRGPSMVLSTACSAGAHAIGQAFLDVRAGRTPLALAGGFECLSELTYSGFSVLRSMATDTIRPFDRNRSGLVLGEGAGIVVLEDRARAVRRGATIYAELAGYGASSDAHHMTAPAPDGEGAARAMELALADAALSADEVGYVSAHGTATRANDPAESRAIHRALGAHAQRTPVSSIKSSIGHLLGAAGAVAAVATILSVRGNAVPPTLHYQERDPECDLEYVPNVGRDARVDAALCNAFGFGGNNCVLAFRKFDGRGHS